MTEICIADETHQMLAATTERLAPTGRRQSNGTWLIDLAPETVDRLVSQKLPGETFDDTIQRMIRSTLLARFS